MKEHNAGKIDGNDYFILTNGKAEIEVPADRCSVARIIGDRLKGGWGRAVKRSI
jgi:hypothetical protein